MAMPKVVYNEIRLTERAKLLLALLIGKSPYTGRKTGHYDLDYDAWVIESYREVMQEMPIEKFHGYYIRNVHPAVKRVLADVITWHSYGGTYWEGNTLYFYFEH